MHLIVSASHITVSDARIEPHPPHAGGAERATRRGVRAQALSLGERLARQDHGRAELAGDVWRKRHGKGDDCLVHPAMRDIEDDVDVWWVPGGAGLENVVAPACAGGKSKQSTFRLKGVRFGGVGGGVGPHEWAGGRQFGGPGRRWAPGSRWRSVMPRVQAG